MVTKLVFKSWVMYRAFILFIRRLLLSPGLIMKQKENLSYKSNPGLKLTQTYTFSGFSGVLLTCQVFAIMVNIFPRPTVLQRYLIWPHPSWQVKHQIFLIYYYFSSLVVGSLALALGLHKLFFRFKLFMLFSSLIVSFLLWYLTEDRSVTNVNWISATTLKF